MTYAHSYACTTTALNALDSDDFPSNTLPSKPKQRSFKIQLPDPVPVHGVPTHTIAIQIQGFELGDAYAVTDFFIQGMNLKNQLWFLHLNPPPTGAFQRCSLLVAITRFSQWAEIHLLCPLWNNDEEKEKVIDYFMDHMAKMDDDIYHELQNIYKLAQETEQSYQQTIALILKTESPIDNINIIILL